MSQGFASPKAKAQLWNGSAWIDAPGDATNGLDVDVTRSVLPTGASTETTLAGVKTGTDKIPATPAQEHSTAASPHSVRLSDGAAYISTLPVSGTVTANAGTGTLGTNVAQIAGTATDANSGTKSAGTQRVVLATDQPALTNALKVDGSAVTQPVSGTFWQATQPVSGTVTANAGSGPFPVSDNAGSLTVDAPVGTPVFVRWSDGTSAIATLPVSGPLTDAQLRASAVPVSLGVALPAGSANIGDVDVLTVPADPFGVNADAAVAAGAAGSIQAKLRRATQGLEDLKSLIVLGAGANAIGKLAANSGVDIGDVDVTSLPSATSATVTQKASSATNITLQASNAARKGLTIFNDSTSTLMVKFGATASATSFTVRIAAGGYWEMPVPLYSGILDGIWAAANGNGYVTEW